jgi:membrane protein DedA with SNARE-associated domain
MPFSDYWADYWEAVLAFTRAHSQWAPLVVLVLAFGESVAIASLILPFWLMLVAVSFVISSAGVLNFWATVSAAAVGAAQGYWLSYWIGYHYHDQVQGMWPLRNQPDLIDRSRVFFKRWGMWAVWLSRFFGPLRATVPIVAGIYEMPRTLFQGANWLSAFAWALVIFGIKRWTGDAYLWIFRLFS